jgi:hypothetical protein
MFTFCKSKILMANKLRLLRLIYKNNNFVENNLKLMQYTSTSKANRRLIIYRNKFLNWTKRKKKRYFYKLYSYFSLNSSNFFLIKTSNMPIIKKKSNKFSSLKKRNIFSNFNMIKSNKKFRRDFKTILKKKIIFNKLNFNLSKYYFKSNIYK